ncbi:hypothetical protein CAPTEDRAFT_136630, partial [Capitella teleta]
KVRMLFVWLATYDLDKIDSINPPEGSVREQLLKIPSQEYSRTQFFIEMCRLAKLEAKEIRRVFRGQYVSAEGLDATDCWAAVMIDQTGRLFDPDSASVKNVQVKPYTQRYDDHYFLTDPEAFIYTNFPLGEEWQLLARPVTRQEFNQLACLHSGFFMAGFTLESHRKNTVESPNGEVDIVVGIMNKNIHQTHALWMKKNKKA